MDWEHVEGSQDTKPDAFDDISSKVYVYIRKNIEQVERSSSEEGEIITLWTYDEAKVTKVDWNKYQEEIIRDNDLIL